MEGWGGGGEWIEGVGRQVGQGGDGAEGRGCIVGNSYIFSGCIIVVGLVGCLLGV